MNAIKLILNDLRFMGRDFIYIILTLIVFMIISIFFKESMAYATPLFILLLFIPYISLYRNTSPEEDFSNKAIAGARYAEALLIFIMTYALSLLVNTLYYSSQNIYISISSQMSISLILPAISFLLLSIWIPLLFRFKKYVHIPIVIISVIVIAAAAIGIQKGMASVPFLSGAISVAVVVFLTLSYFISIRILKKVNPQ